MKTRPVIHGRDHACGGADPIPGYCALLEGWQSFIGGGDYTSIQTAVSITDSGGSPTLQAVLHWPTVTVTDIAEHITAGYDLYGHIVANVYHVEMLQLRIAGHSLSGPTIPSGDWETWTRVDTTGILLPHAGTYTGADPATTEVLTQSEQSNVTVSGGSFTLTWVPTGDPPPTGTAGRPWPGSYPIVNTDVAAAADINPTKLDHPGGTTAFLRGDGTWSTLTIEVEY